MSPSLWSFVSAALDNTQLSSRGGIVTGMFSDMNAKVAQIVTKESGSWEDQRERLEAGS